MVGLCFHQHLGILIEGDDHALQVLLFGKVDASFDDSLMTAMQSIKYTYADRHALLP
ncbi:hypothetical protein SDC9_68369 [bioreactor metagenome]|uniref:Uncharacterized protein n=1 Tax=bioreactor metagenome TaxID=1076179 RepID=A0A644Y0N8_9ZZZZ